MKTLKLFLAGILTLGASTAQAVNIGSPEEINFKIYEMWVSESGNCTDMVRIYNDASPSYQDMVAGPTFGQVNVPNGTYECVAFRLGDVITLTPDFDSDIGNCEEGVEITRDLFRVGDSATGPTGDVITGHGALGAEVEDTMWVYLSTSGDDNNGGYTPSDPSKLDNAYVVSANNDAVFVTDFTNGLEDTGGSCSPEIVTFGFRYN